MTGSFFSLVTVPLEPTSPWIRGTGSYPNVGNQKDLAVGLTKLCYIYGLEGERTCMEQSELCSLNETAIYCNVAKESKLSIGLMWGVFGLQFVHMGCAGIFTWMSVDGFNGLGVVIGIVVVLLAAVILGLHSWAFVMEKNIMQQVYESDLLSKPYAGAGEVCAYISSCLIILEFVSAFIGIVLSLAMMHKKSHKKAKKKRAEEREYAPLLTTTDS